MVPLGVTPVPVAAHAVVRAGRVNARGARRAGRGGGRGGGRGSGIGVGDALVHVLFTACAVEPRRARAALRRRAHAAVQAPARAYRWIN